MLKVEIGFGNAERPIPFDLKEGDLPQWKQVHGVKVAEVFNNNQHCGDVDALVTRQPGVAIAVRTADCVPILLAAPSLGVTAAIHAGWRGTYARIVESVWNSLLPEEKSAPEKWKAWIGPSIRECCYEVSPELFSQFKKEFPKTSFLKKNFLDLSEINLTVLNTLGIDNVENLAECTYCTKNSSVYKFNSFRRESSNLRQFSLTRLVPES